MAGMVDVAMGAVGGVLMIFIFLEVLKPFTWSYNTNISSGAIALLNIVDLVLAAGILLAVVLLAFQSR